MGTTAVLLILSAATHYSAKAIYCVQCSTHDLNRFCRVDSKKSWNDVPKRISQMCPEDATHCFTEYNFENRSFQRGCTQRADMCAHRADWECAVCRPKHEKETCEPSLKISQNGSLSGSRAVEDDPTVIYCIQCNPFYDDPKVNRKDLSCAMEEDVDKATACGKRDTHCLVIYHPRSGMYYRTCSLKQSENICEGLGKDRCDYCAPSGPGKSNTCVAKLVNPTPPPPTITCVRCAFQTREDSYNCVLNADLSQASECKYLDDEYCYVRETRNELFEMDCSKKDVCADARQHKPCASCQPNLQMSCIPQITIPAEYLAKTTRKTSSDVISPTASLSTLPHSDIPDDETTYWDDDSTFSISVTAGNSTSRTDHDADHSETDHYDSVTVKMLTRKSTAETQWDSHGSSFCILAALIVLQHLTNLAKAGHFIGLESI